MSANDVIPTNFDLTSANATIKLVFPEIYPSGITASMFDEGDMLTLDNVDTKEFKMTADGVLTMGIVYNPINATLHLSAISPLVPRLNTITQRERQLVRPFRCNMVVSLPSSGYRYEFINGAIASTQVMPSLSKTQSSVTVAFNFQSISASKI